MGGCTLDRVYERPEGVVFVSVPDNDLLKIIHGLNEYNRDLHYAIARTLPQKQRVSVRADVG